MTIQPDEEELHVIPNAGAPGTAGGGFRVIDRTDATDEEFRARVAEFDAAPEPSEIVVERVARAIFNASNPITETFPDYWLRLRNGEETRDHYRRLAAAAIAAMRDAR